MPRQGGITSGKPIVTKELYSRAAPEVTISKTNSPRGIPYNEVAANNLASLVDVAVQQPKIDLTQIRSQQQQAAALLALANNTKAANSLVSVGQKLSKNLQDKETNFKSISLISEPQPVGTAGPSRENQAAVLRQ